MLSKEFEEAEKRKESIEATCEFHYDVVSFLVILWEDFTYHIEEESFAWIKK
jgi:hypothetical protein